MEEILELRKSIQEGRYSDALHIIDELEEMAKDDKISKIFSYMEVLLIHLIKQHVENRSTRSWENSIEYASERIIWINTRRKSGGYYLTNDELFNELHDSFRFAIKQAAQEAFEGQFSFLEIEKKIDKNKILAEAMQMIQN